MRSFDACAANPAELARLWAPVAAQEQRVYDRLYGRSSWGQPGDQAMSGQTDDLDDAVASFVTDTPTRTAELARMAGVGPMTALSALRRLERAEIVACVQSGDGLTRWQLA